MPNSTASPVLLVVGYGPGVSHATAERFGREGFRVALVGRSAERVEAGAASLERSGVTAAGFIGDASDLGGLRAAVARVQREVGPVSALLWTAYRGGHVTDVLAVQPDDVERAFDIGVRGLLGCVQQIRGDLQASEAPAILVANGAVGEHSTEADGFAKMFGIDGVGLENAAKSKLVGILAERLRDEGVYVGEITIAGSVAGTATASPTAIDPAAIADEFWGMTQDRQRTRVRIAE